MSGMRARAGATRVVEGADIERPGSAETGHVLQCRIPIDQALAAYPCVAPGVQADPDRFPAGVWACINNQITFGNHVCAVAGPPDLKRGYSRAISHTSGDRADRRLRAPWNSGSGKGGRGGQVGIGDVGRGQ